jgi:hypothetical protein
MSQLLGISEIFLEATKNTNSTYRLILGLIYSITTIYDDHDHICYRFAQVQIFGGKSNVFKSLHVFGYKRQNDNVGNLISKMTT